MGSEVVDSVGLGFTGDASSLLSAFTRSLNAWDTFQRRIETGADRVSQRLDSTFGAASRTVAQLSGDVRGLDKALKGLADAEDKAGEGAARGAGATERTAKATKDTTDAVKRLSLEYRAGKITLDEYIGKLKDVAKASVDGSDRQLTALAGVRDAEAKTAQAAEQSANRQIAATEKAARAQELHLSRVLKMADTVGNGLKSAGANLTKFLTAPLVGAGAYSFKVAVDSNEAFAQVRKQNLAASKEQLDTLEKQLRALSQDKLVGTGFVDLSKIAAEGSQQGIDIENLAEFTKQIAMASKAGDASGEEIATGMAKIAQATGTPQREIKNMTSSLVAMGAQGASSLGEVKDVAQRFASEGSLVGLKPGDLFAFGNAVVSLGQQAEAGGSALTKSFAKVDKAVNQGGDGLKRYANTAKMSATDFTKAWREDPGQAFLAFMAGLDKAGASAGRVDKILDELGVKQIAERTALKNLAKGHDLLATSINAARDAYAAGDEQQKKAAEQAKSWKSQLGELKREMEADANMVGEKLVPAVLDMVKAGRPFLEVIRDAAQRFHEMSPEAQQAWLKVALGLALIGPLVSGLGNVVLWVVKAREAFALLKAVDTARELAQTAKTLSDVASASSGTVNGINAVASSASAATTEAGLLARTLAALASTSPITIPIIIAAAIAGALAVNSTNNSEAEIARMEQETAVDDARKDTAAARKTLAGLKDYKGQLQNAGYASTNLPQGEMRDKLGIEGWRAPGLPNLDTVLGKDRKGGGTIDKEIAALEARIKRNNGIIASAARQQKREAVQTPITLAASQAETEIAKNMVKAAASESLGGKNLQAGCAIFVSTVLKKAGADFDGSPVAKDLRDKLLKQGGQARDIKNAKPGDVVFFEGKNFGAIKTNGKGFHTGVYMGGGMVRDEGSRGVTTRAIASIVGRQADARVYAVSVPDKLGTSRHVRLLNGDVPFDPSLFRGKDKKGKTAPAVKTGIAPPVLEDLTPLEELFSGKPLSSLPTSAKNYADKKRELEGRFAERRDAARSAGKPLDEYTDGMQEQSQNKTLAMNALRNTEKAIGDLLPKLEKEKQATEAARVSYNAIVQSMNAKRVAHQDISAAEQQQEADAKKAYRDALARYKADVQALEENKRVHSDALRDKTQATNALNELQKKQDEKNLKAQEETRKKWLAGLEAQLKAGTLKRLDYEKQLADGIERIKSGTHLPGSDAKEADPAQNALNDSAADRKKTQADTRRRTLTTNGKDFEAQRQALKEEMSALEAKGVDLGTRTGYEAARNKEIDLTEWQKSFHELQEKSRADLDDGKVSLSDYKAFLSKQLDSVIAKFGETSVEASKLHREIDHVTWQQADESASRFRQSLDNGDLSLQAYIAQLRALQATLPEASAEYRKLGDQIDQANRRMIQQARATGDRVGGEFGQGIVRAMRRQSSFSGVLRDMFNKAVDEAAAGAIKRFVSNMVFKWINKGDHGKVAAEEKQLRAAGVQQASAVKMEKSANVIKEAMDTFAANVSKLAGKMDAAPGNGTPGASSGDPLGDAAKGSAKNWAIAAAEKYGNVSGSDISNAENVYSIASGGSGRATIPGADGTTNMAATAGMNAASAGAFGAGAAAAVPWVAGALAVTSLVMGMVNKPQKPDFTTKTGDSRYAFLGNGDHTGLIDSGYSGVEGMRTLQAANASRAAMSASASRSTTNHIAAGAITIVMRPDQDHMAVAKQVMTELTAQTSFEDSLNGNG